MKWCAKTRTIRQGEANVVGEIRNKKKHQIYFFAGNRAPANNIDKLAHALDFRCRSDFYFVNKIKSASHFFWKYRE